jgi:hypothetical protein
LFIYIYVGDTLANQGEVIGCSFSSSNPIWQKYLVIDRIFISGNNDGFRIYSPLMNIPNDVCIHSNGYASAISINWVGAGTYNACEFVIKNAYYGHNWLRGSAIADTDLNVYDCTGFDISKCKRGTNTYYTNCYCNEYYSLNYNVRDKQNIPISGATVVATNGFGIFTGTTDSDGDVVIDVKVKSMDIGAATLSVVDNSATTFTISALGFETIKDAQILSQKMVDVCCLQRSPYASQDEMGSNWI